MIPWAVFVGCVAAGSALIAQRNGLPATACGRELDVVVAHFDDVEGQLDRRLKTRVGGAVVSFLFHRRKDAMRGVDAALETIRGPAGQSLAPELRKNLATDLGALWSCLSTVQPPAMATLTVRTFVMQHTPSAGTRAAAGAGVYVKVEGMFVGRTGEDGTLTTPVPSGPIRVQALVPSTSLGAETVSLEPGTSGAVSIVLDGDKEVTEGTELVVAEAVDDTVQPDSTTFTIKFVRDDTLVPVTRLLELDLLDRNRNIDRHLEELFKVKDGAIVARNPAAVLEIFRARAGELVLRVHGYDAATGFTHANDIHFRLAPRR